MVKKIIDEIEKEKFSFLLGFLTLFSIILTRNILESSFEGKQILGFSEIVSHSFYMIFVHFPLYYISHFAWIILVFKLLTKEKTIKITKVMITGMTVIIIAPVVDIIVSKGSGYKLTYLTGPETFTEIPKFFYFTKDLLLASWGQRVEISLVFIGSFYYVFIKTKNFLKSLLAPIIICLIIFIHGALPNTIAKIPSYMGFKDFSTRAILGSGTLAIDSQNYAVIFCISVIIAGILIALTERKKINEVLDFKSSYGLIGAAFLGIFYALFLIFRYYPFLLINPIFYLTLMLGIIIVIFTNKISYLDSSSFEFQILATGVILFGISLGYVFLILILLFYLSKRFLKPSWLSILPSFIVGFSLICQEATPWIIIPVNKELIELKGAKLAGWSFFLNGEYKKSLLIYLKIHSIQQENETQKRIGQCHLNLGRIEAGIKELEKIKDPDYETFLTLGQAYTQSGKIEKAINIYKKAIEEGISPEEFYVKIAQTASRNDLEDELNTAIEKAALYGTPKHKLYQIKADFYFRKGNLEEAEEMYNKSLDFNPRSVASISGKGLIYYKQGKIKEAEKQLLEALKIEKKDDAIYNNLGIIYLAQNSYKKAEKYFNKSLKINPNQEEAYYNLGLIYEMKGEKMNALQMYERALNVNPNYIPAKIKTKVLKK